MKQLKQATIQLGGDMFVLQARGMPSGQETLYKNDYQYRACGRTYKFSEKNIALDKDSMQEYRMPRVSTLNLLIGVLTSAREVC